MENLDKVEQIKENYLNKIIDQKISLLLLLNVQSFSPIIAEIISKNIDANQFLSYVEDEFIRRDKIGRVQIDQQLFVFIPLRLYKILLTIGRRKKENNDG